MTAVASGRRPPTGKKAPRPKPRPEPPRSEPSQVDEQGALDAVEVLWRLREEKNAFR